MRAFGISQLIYLKKFLSRNLGLFVNEFHSVKPMQFHKFNVFRFEWAFLVRLNYWNGLDNLGRVHSCGQDYIDLSSRNVLYSS